MSAEHNTKIRLSSCLNFLDIGDDTAECSSSLSWHNKTETKIIGNLVQQLLRTSGIERDHIMVLTEYHAQIKELKTLAGAQGLSGLRIQNSVDINTVDASQGAESKIVILSLVRTRDNVGFLSSRNR